MHIIGAMLPGKFKIMTLAFIMAVTFGLVCSAEGAIPDKIRIGVVASTGQAAYKNAGSVKFVTQGNYQVIDLSAFPGTDLIGEVKEGSTWQVAYLTTGLQVLCDGEALKITSGPVVVREVSHNSDNFVKLTGFSVVNGTSETAINKRYRGDMEFRLGTGYLIGVNELPFEEYLYSVVPREMSNSWPIEALKAQALAARTYAAVNFNRRISLGFNLLDTPDDQAYGGLAYEGARSTQAVQETAGEIITYDSKPISAVYHSNSGGHTEDNENVWAGPPLGYLRGKKDPYSLKCKFGSWTYSTVATGKDSLGRQGVQDKLQALDPKFGVLAGISLEKYSSGRVKNVVITDTEGYTIEKSGSQFGKIFNPSFYTYLNEESFMSNFFEVRIGGGSLTVMDSTAQKKDLKETAGLMGVLADGSVAALDTGSAEIYAVGGSEVNQTIGITPSAITFAGHGWGHGVGMSQWGAYQMATEGKDYKEIITFYYTGVEVVKG